MAGMISAVRLASMLQGVLRQLLVCWQCALAERQRCRQRRYVTSGRTASLYKADSSPYLGLQRRRLVRDFKRLSSDPPGGVSGAPRPDNIVRTQLACSALRKLKR